MLLAKEDVTYKKAGQNANNAQWLSVINSALANVETPSGLNCDKWRVPTLEETLIFVQDPSVVTLSKTYVLYACMVDGSLGWIRYGLNEAGEFDYTSKPAFGSVIPLRPVITITY